MQIAIRVLVYLAVNFCLMALAEKYGFGVVHSAALMFLMVAICPGVLVLLLIAFDSETLAWAVVFVVNVVYYECIRSITIREWARHRGKVYQTRPAK